MRALRSLSTTAAAVLVLAGAPTATDAQSVASPRDNLIVTSAWLAAHLRDPDLVLLHVGDRAEYDRAHIPGARYVSMQDVSVSSMDHEHGLMLEMPSAEALRARLAALGISDRSRVVVYYGNDWVSPATRIIFTLDYAGLGDRSALLDGGMNAWKAESRPVTAEVPAASTGTLSALHVRPLVVDAAYVDAHRSASTVRLIDGRGAVFYDGVELGSGRKGHIAGARNIPFNSVWDDANRLKSPAELAAIFTAAGVGPRDTVLAYCHIGQQATSVLFAARALGHPVLLYDGSFQEWGRRPELAVENPADGRHTP